MSTFLIEQPANYEQERPRKHRATLSRTQLARLVDEFDNNNNPSMDTRMRLAAELDMETKQISSWFQNRRQSIKNRLSGSASSSHQYLLQPSSPAQDQPTTTTDPAPMPRFTSTFHVQHNGPTPPPASTDVSAPLSALGVVVAPDQATKEEPQDHIFQPAPPAPSTRGSPTPSEASVTSHQSLSIAASYPPSRSLHHPTRSSTRARSARLASSPIPPSRGTLINMGEQPVTGPTHRRTASSGTTGTSRARMSEAQRDVLQEYYDNIDSSPSMEERQRLANVTGLEISKVTNWFRNLRQAMRKAKLRDEEVKANGALTGSSPHLTPYAAASATSNPSAHANSNTQAAASRPIPIPIAHGSVEATPSSYGHGHGRTSITHSNHTQHALIPHHHLHHTASSRSHSNGRPRHHTRYPSADGDSSSGEEDDDEESDTMEAITPWASPDTKVEHSFQSSSRSHHHHHLPQSPPMFTSGRRLPLPMIPLVPGSASPSPYSRFSPLPVQIVEDSSMIADEEFEIDMGDGKTRRVDGADVRDALLLLHFKRGGVAGNTGGGMDGLRAVKF